LPAVLQQLKDVTAQLSSTSSSSSPGNPSGPFLGLTEEAKACNRYFDTIKDILVDGRHHNEEDQRTKGFNTKCNRLLIAPF
ncbi:hypothetical protein ATANTOWER_006147, partial [Ataeniobius toweri]|nr:hypothetical protein [Ataeniobius toweri]